MPGFNNGNHGIGRPPRASQKHVCCMKNCEGVAFYASTDGRGRTHYFCEAHREEARQVARTRMAIRDEGFGDREREFKQVDRLAVNHRNMRACVNGHR